MAGNFHVAPGKAFQSAQGQLVHEFKPFDTHLPVSHQIHPLVRRALPQPRQPPRRRGGGEGRLGRLPVLREGGAHHVPVRVRALARLVPVPVTDQFKSAHDPAASFVLPGVFFIYDISPIMVKFTEKTMSFSYFLTSLCAIVGGVFTTAGTSTASCITRRR